MPKGLPPVRLPPVTLELIVLVAAEAEASDVGIAPAVKVPSPLRGKLSPVNGLTARRLYTLEAYGSNLSSGPNLRLERTEGGNGPGLEERIDSTALPPMTPVEPCPEPLAGDVLSLLAFPSLSVLPFPVR